MAGNCCGEAVTDLLLLSHPARRLRRNVPRPGRRGTVAETGEVELRMLVDTRHQAETFNQSMECGG